MQPYLLPPEGRLRHWKDFRLSLDENMTDEEHLDSTMKYWNQYPVVNRYIDPYEPETWPTPWELIYENDFCRSTLAYMMEQTLLLSKDGRWLEDRLQLKYINDEELGMEFIILVIDNKHVINYDHDQIFNLDSVLKSCIIHHEYMIDESRHFIV